MLVIRERSVSIMVLFAIALHFWWMVMILVDQSALDATGPASLYRYIHHPDLLAVVLGTAASMAGIALYSRLAWAVVLLLPQQVILMMSAAGAIEAMWLSQFADGLVRSRAFISMDQMYSVLAAIGHTTAITAHAMRRLVPGNGRH